MAKVYISYVIDGGIEVDIPQKLLDNNSFDNEELREFVDNYMINIHSQELLNGLNMNDADSIIVKSVYDDNKEYL